MDVYSLKVFFEIRKRVIHYAAWYVSIIPQYLCAFLRVFYPDIRKRKIPYVAGYVSYTPLSIMIFQKKMLGFQREKIFKFGIRFLLFVLVNSFSCKCQYHYCKV